MTERALPPGTPIFGIAFGDGSCGCWTADRAETRRMEQGCREFGLTIGARLTVRMKREELIEVLP